MMEIKEFLERFHGVEKTRHENEWSAQCPCHDDKKNSLTITYDENTKNIALNDSNGCCIQDILRAVGCDWKDIYHDNLDWQGLGRSKKNEITAIYDYGEGQRKIRYKDKKMSFQHKDPDTGKWKNGKGDAWKECLFVKGSLEDDSPVIFLEGEKDAVNTRNQLLYDYTTCSTPYGAIVAYPSAKWHEEYGQQLDGKTVYILGDYDSKGYKHIKNLSQALYGKAKEIYVLYIEDIFPEAKDKWDISDAMVVLGVDVARARLEKAIAEAKPIIPSEFTFKDTDSVTLSNGKVLDFGDYEISPSGAIVSTVDNEEFTVCTHVLYITEIRRDWETGKEKYVLHYEIGKKEKDDDIIPQGDIVVDPELLFDSRRIVSLSVYGISITSGESAKRIQTYLRYILDLNRQNIPTSFSTTAYGWRDDYQQFIPYTQQIIHDGDERFHSLFEGITQKGDFDKWKEEAVACRAYSKEVKIAMASAFASPLLAPLDCLCSIVHLWSTKSGIGKTVALDLCGSIYGDPARYCKTFNVTTVASEVLLSELQNLPACMDESMLVSDGHGGFRVSPYEICEGVGRTRSNKNLGLNAELHWCNIILTTGEAPLTSNGDGAGAYNRIIDILCRQELFENPRHTLVVAKHNFGWAGRKFIEALLANDSAILNDIDIRHENIMQDLLDAGATEKQAVTAACIILADEIACENVLETSDPLTVKDMIPYLKGDDDIDTGIRAYHYLIDWVSMNVKNFQDEQEGVGFRGNQFYGKICYPDADTKYGTRIVKIVRACFDKMCEEGGFSSKSVIEWLDSKGYLRRRADGKISQTLKQDGISNPAYFVEIPWDKRYETDEFDPKEEYMDEREPDDDLDDSIDSFFTNKEEKEAISPDDITPMGNIGNSPGPNISDFAEIDDDDDYRDLSDFRPLT